MFREVMSVCLSVCLSVRLSVSYPGRETNQHEKRQCVVFES